MAEQLDVIEGNVREITELANGKIKISVRKKMTVEEMDAFNARAAANTSNAGFPGGGTADVVPGEEIYKARVKAADFDPPLAVAEPVHIVLFRGEPA